MISINRVIQYYQTGTDISRNKSIFKDELGNVYYLEGGKLPSGIKVSKTLQKCADYPDRPRSQKRIRWSKTKVVT